MKRLAVLIALLLTGCAVSTAILPTAPPPPTQTLTPVPPGYWIQEGVPPEILTAVEPVLQQSGLIRQPAPDGAAVRLALNPDPQAALTIKRVYALVAPFPTVPDGVTWEGFKQTWQTGDTAGLPGFYTPPALTVTSSISAWLTGQFGAPKAAVQIADTIQIDALWAARPALAILLFEQLSPRWKVLSIDGLSPLDKSLDTSRYPLTLTVGLIGEGEAGLAAIEAVKSSGVWPESNRDPAHITTVVLTGTTALTRATAYTMETHGLTYPADNILPFLADADILHTSNEVSFSRACPPPEMVGDAKFCSNPKYMELLTHIGLDVVELTGNHNNDYGTAPFNASLELYAQNHMVTYGGGKNLTDALTPHILTAPDGTHIAFVGCNSAGPFKAWATDFSPGAAPCGDWIALRQQIADLKATHQTDVVIATLQYAESPSYTPTEQQKADFEALAAAGADIVSGSQAHQPQGFSFASGKVIHFGVGNLFFDQMDFVENRQMFADKYVLYQGKIISLVLFTGMNENYSQPRPMTEQERADFLKIIFTTSGW